MDRLATLPVFLKLRGKIAIMAGGDLPAVWKTELLAAAGAEVHVVAATLCKEMADLVATLQPGSVRVVPRAWEPGDLRGAAVALGAIEDEAEAERFSAAARAAGVPVNVIDKPAFCDFQFGTIVARSPLVIGISTDGAAPVFGQALRARIEGLLPQGLQRWAQAAQDWRPAVQARALDFRKRRRFWEVFTARALAAPGRVPSDEDQAACFAAIDGMGSALGQGRVSFVGAGRDGANDVTLGAIGILQSADLLVYDADVAPDVIALARREAIRRPAAAEGDTLFNISAIVAEGRHVVWLGTGDPRTCRRWRERISTLPQTLAIDIQPGLARCPTCALTCRDPIEALADAEAKPEEDEITRVDAC